MFSFGYQDSDSGFGGCHLKRGLERDSVTFLVKSCGSSTSYRLGVPRGSG